MASYVFVNRSKYTPEQKQRFEAASKRRNHYRPPRIIFAVLCPVVLIGAPGSYYLIALAGPLSAFGLFIVFLILTCVFSRKCRQAYAEMIAIDKAAGANSSICPQIRSQRFYCSKCGALNDQYATECRRCGAHFKRPA